MDTLFFIAAKLVGSLIRVETWALVLAIFAAWGAWRENPRRAKRASGILVALLLAIGFLPLGDVLLRPIEMSVAGRDASGAVDGILLLGGGEDVQASRASGQAQLGEGGDRYLAALALAHDHPEATLLFAGGSGRLRDVNGAEVSEAAIAERIILGQRISPNRLLLESRSRNTAENARFALELAQPEPDEIWVLVTSAFHMPRALRSFEAAGWPSITPHPVDYRTRSWQDGLGWAFTRNLAMFNTAIREWVGRAAYAVTGR